MFRDETHKTAHKASTRTSKQRNSRSARQSTPTNSTNAVPSTKLITLASSNTPEEVSRSLSTSLNQQAICFFLHNYVVPCLPTSGRVGYLHSLQSTTSDAVVACMASVGMATLANINYSADLRIAAREQYGHALSLTNAMLRDPVKARQPTALDTVMLLGMFEVVTCRSNRSLSSWRSHHEGALALLKINSKPGPEDIINFRMFVQARGQILSSCLLTSSRAPPFLQGVPREQQGCLPKSEGLLEDVTTLLVKLCNLRAEIEDRSLVSPEDIIPQALAQEKDFTALFSELWEYYPYNTLAVIDRETPPSPADEVYGKYYHTYTDYFVPNIYNAIRGARILVTEIIEEAAAKLSPSSPLYAQYDNLPLLIEQSRAAALQAAIDICASVPYDLGSIEMKRKDGTNVGRRGRALGGYILLWPLCLAGDLPYAPTSLREWAINRFEYIGRALGIKQAIWMAALLRLGSMRSLLTTLRISDED
ncbi:hypothetical protein H109_00285 [Trichophyton interdigitale MR816]|uniref:C6 finger domain-containing protein n=1 Tax=Trichophyton interdigitale (strain MR816) TaxID=1215338 RepID=A0A059JJI2_TRIIM|nr:hypothetical protein H109_00285 [Trichophyton interdigitale MR816]